MSTKDIKKKSAAKLAELKREDIKLYRLMVECGLAVLLVLLVIVANNNKFAFNKTGMDISVIVSGILFAASAVWFTIGKKKNIDEDLKVITCGGIFGNAAVLFASCFHYSMYQDHEELIVLIICAAVLYFVYNIYSKLYFAYSLIAGAGFIALLLSSREYTSNTLGILVVNASKVMLFAIPVIAILFTVLYARRSKMSKYAMTCSVAMSAIVLAGAVLTLVYPVAAIYALFTLLGFYIISTVIYTVRMM